MLTGIGLRNFKAFGNEMQEAPLSKITLIYGPNSGGKSSIIQALLLLKQSHEEHNDHWTLELIHRGRYVDLGRFSSLIHKHDTERNLDVQVKFDALNQPSANPLIRRGPSIRRRRHTSRTHSLGYGCVDMTFVAEPFDEESARDSSKLSRVKYELIRENQRGFDVQLELDRNLDDLNEIPRFKWHNNDSIDSYAQFVINERLNSRRGSTQVLRGTRLLAEESPNVKALSRTLTQSSVETFRTGGMPYRVDIPRGLDKMGLVLGGRLSMPTVDDYLTYMDNIIYLGPLRNRPERFYDIFGGTRHSVGTRGEFTPHVLRDDDTTENINKWFKYLEIPYDMEATALGDELTGGFVSIALTDSRTGTRVALTDVGFGINQVLPVMVNGIASPDDSILCVEQPEIHLHPRLQANIADLMIDTIADEPGKRKQWIVETHSELLILRLQRRIREGKIKPEDISVLYVDPNDKYTEGSAIKVLRLGENSYFKDQWPDGFFDEALKEELQPDDEHGSSDEGVDVLDELFAE